MKKVVATVVGEFWMRSDKKGDYYGRFRKNSNGRA